MTEETTTQDRAPWATRETYRVLQEAEQELETMRDELRRMKNCGMECQVLQALANEFRERLQAVRREFFNPPPV